jgi:hypothetical protein
MIPLYHGMVSICNLFSSLVSIYHKNIRVTNHWHLGSSSATVVYFNKTKVSSTFTEDRLKGILHFLFFDGPTSTKLRDDHLQMYASCFNHWQILKCTTATVMFGPNPEEFISGYLVSRCIVSLGAPLHSSK